MEGCPVYSDACEIMEFYDETFPRAKKRHVCIECRLPIQPGEKYARCCGKWDGSVSTMCQHMHCYHFARYVNLDALAEPQHTDLRFPIQHGAIVMSNGTRVQLEDTWYKVSDCIPFGEIREALQDMQADDLLYQWNAMLAGMNEVFSGGSGI